MKMKFLVSLFFFTNCFRELHSNTENRNHLGQWRLDVIKLLFHSNFQKIYLKKIKNNTSKLQLFVTFSFAFVSLHVRKILFRLTAKKSTNIMPVR